MFATHIFTRVVLPIAHHNYNVNWTIWCLIFICPFLQNSGIADISVQLCYDRWKTSVDLGMLTYLAPFCRMKLCFLAISSFPLAWQTAQLNVEVMKYNLCAIAPTKKKKRQAREGEGERRSRAQSPSVMNSLLCIGRCLIILVKPR